MKLPRQLFSPPVLMLSVTLNLILGIVTFSFWGEPVLSSRPAKVVAAAKPRTVKAPPPVVAKAPPPFRWSQLETPDFATYVQNLRGIGCPEATIRDIVRGELAEIYAQKRQEATAQSRGRVREAEMMKLQSEEDQLLMKLTAPAAGGTVASSAAPAMANAQTFRTEGESAGTSVSAASPVRDIPVAFTYGSKAGEVITQQGAQMVLNAQGSPGADNAVSAEALTAIKQDFVQALGDMTDPESEGYRMRWQQARQHADERFSSMYGGDAFVRAQSQSLPQAPTAAANQ